MTAAPEDPGDLTAFAAEVYGTARSRTSLARFADHVYGREETTPYHSPAAVRAHWFAEWRRRMGYDRLEGDYDNTILWTAVRGKGQGKSAGAIDMGFELDRRFGDEWRSKLTYKPADFLDIVNSLSRYEVGILDDAGDSLLRTEFWSDAARLLTKAMIVSRDTHATAIICIPSIGLFNGAVLNSLVDYWVRVKSRGNGEVHPRPGERYTKPRGIGWFPDREWGPYTWPDPHDWPEERRTMWLEYRKFRKSFRRESLDVKAEELRKGGPIAGTIGPRHRCEPCGVTFQRKDQLRRHLGTAKHRERSAAPPSPAPARERGDPASSRP